MSVLQYKDRELKTISPNFYRTWVGTREAYEADKDDIPNGSLIYITDDTAEDNTLQRVYPVGSVYISFNSTNPATLFGFGTWESLGNDIYLKTAGASEAAGANSGSNTKTLTIANIPTHAHTFLPSGTVTSSFTGTASSHTHNVYTNLDSASYTRVYSGANSAATGVVFTNDTGSRGYKAGPGASTQFNQSVTIIPTGSVSSTFTGSNGTTNTVGSATAIDIRPNSIAVYMFRRVA